jgi:NAD(P)-dependent dehydrogenase (short-subunit alcohol dehydrogenase family)
METRNANLQPQPRVWFITGCSSGFGRVLAEAALAHGDRVIATARRLDQIADLSQRYNERCYVLPLDVTLPRQVHNAVEEGVAVFGQIDVLVNNAGYGLLGAVEEVEEDEIRREFETNVFGLLSVTRAVLPHMREQRRGTILNLSSVGGFSGFAGWGIYSASKFAVEGLSEALAQEVAPLGIHVTIVEPGYFRTNFGGSSMNATAREIPDYAPTSGQTRAYMAQISGHQPGDPARAAQAIIAVVESGHPPLRLVLGADALQRVRAKLASVTQELDAWEQTTINTAFEQEAPSPG